MAQAKARNEQAFMSDPVIETGVHSRHPQTWEEEKSFHDLVYEWTERAPWLVISFVSHVLLFLLLAVVPWSIFKKQEVKIITQAPPAIVEEVFDDPIIEPEVVDEIEPTDQPQLQDAEVADVQQTDNMQDSDSVLGDELFSEDSAFQDVGESSLIGVGGNAGGKMGGRFGGNKRGAGGTARHVTEGLAWLASHQDADGKWDTDNFMKHDPAADPCSGPGRSEHDVGVTGLALLAFLGDGHTTRSGLYQDRVSKAVKWLREQQDFDSGLIGDMSSKAFLYDHGIASLALCEAYYFSKSPIIRASAQKSVGFLSQARNPYGVWRYDAPASGDNDTSVTGWMVFAMKAAEEGGLKVDSAAFNDSIHWFDEVTDPVSGRVGYSSLGELSSREPGVNEHYPREKTEAMTAVGLLCRFFLGQDPSQEPIMVKHADLLLKTLPQWDDQQGLTNDLYYWYYGSYAMYQMGGKHWKAWNKAMKKALVDSQERSGSAKGSWDPNGPWGHVGGRVYSTALGVLCLEVYFRYARVLGAR
ncbi:MAG: hypothetical protein ACI9F9_000790 [Candidatus Paceibacteria bacterium]|jgi:hypothetical protein